MLRRISTALALAATIIALPGLARGDSNRGLIAVEQIHQVESPRGGADYYTDQGTHVGRSLREGTIGVSFYGPSGVKLGYCTKNTLGGWDYFTTIGKKLGQSRLTKAGGFELLDNLGIPLGHSFDDSTGYFHFFLGKSLHKRSLLPGKGTLSEGPLTLLELLK